MTGRGPGDRIEGRTEEAPSTREWQPSFPLDLAATLAPLLRGTGDPTMRWDREGTHGVPGVWRTMRTPVGAATLHLAQRASGAVCATAWGPGAEWVLDRLPELLGEGDDWSGLDVSSVPMLADTLRRRPGLRLTRIGLVVEMLVPSVLEQRITGVEARRAWRLLVTEYGELPPGPAPAGMRVFPAPEVWRRIPSWTWHRAGVDPARSRTCIRVAEVAAGLERTLEHGRGGPVVEQKLRSVTGVGVWTAAETAQRSHGDADAVSVGDYHVHDTVGYALTGEPASDERMLELLEPWRGHRQRVVRLIYASGFRKPRFGPRMTIQDHRAH